MTKSTPDEREVGPDLGDSLVDGAVRTLFGLSWNRARDLVRRGKILLDGEIVTSPTLRVRPGAKLAIDLAARSPRAVREELPRDALVHVDPHIVVVEKPSGISTVPFDPEGMGASLARRAAGPGEEATLDQRVRAALAKRGHHRGPPPELGVVHRLDKDTSGLLVFTRTWAAKKALTQAFRVHAVHRRYLALVHGIPRDQTITSHLVENRGDGLRGSVEKRGGRKRAIGSERTQRAITHIEVLARFPGQGERSSGGAGQPCALVACVLETGRTHQIRIHLAEAGHPLLGERVYTRGYPGALVPAPRIMLHAAELGFDHPASGERVDWTSEPPADMQEMLAFVRG